MNATIENLRIFLEERDIGGFLAAYETMVPVHNFNLMLFIS